MLTSSTGDIINQPIWILFPLFLGIFSLTKQIFTFLNSVFIIFLRPPKNLKNTYGQWALVTGATDGIGKSITFQLAHQGLNLILVSRNPNKLKTVSREIKAEFPNTHIKIVPLEFSGDLYGGIRRLEAEIEGFEVGVLVNNVGITYNKAMFFHEVDEEMWMDIVKVNVIGTTLVTKVVLPGMILRKKGAVVNIGSGASVVVPSHPLYAIYAATKAYIDQLSRCLYVEYRHYGIHVQCQVPLYVATNMVSKVAEIKKSSLFVPLPDDYARAAIRRIGYESRCTPYWSHSVQWYLAGFLSDRALDAWRLSIGMHRRG